MTIFRIRNRFKPPENDRTWIRLLAESHQAFDGFMEPYHERMEHFHAGLKPAQSFICSKIWKEKEDGELEGSGKCLLCKEIDDGSRAVSIRQLDAFLLLHLDWYYRVQVTDRKGHLLEYDSDTKFHKKGDPIMTRIWQEADDKELKWLEITRRDLLKNEKVFGNLLHWSVGPRFLGTLSSKIDDLTRHCTCGGRLDTEVWECRHCEKEVFDLTNDGANLPESLTAKQANQIALSEYRCPFCGNVDFLIPVRNCNKCVDPEPLRLWDVDLEVGRTGSGMQSNLVIFDHRHCELDDRLDEYLMPNRPRLHRVFAPDSLKYQAERLGIRNPYEDVGKHVQDRSEKDQDPPDNDDSDVSF